MVCNCEALPFNTKQFDIVTAAFGVRNMTDQLKAMQEVYRVLNYGGKALILEFSQPIECIKTAYDFYSFNIIPKLGKLIANDEASYQYLVESIRMHPNQEAFSDILKQAGFSNVKYINLNLGIVALHIAYK
jgi:demethylmenaquinone methyltransferase/2-methoxy-6-polyprenyl-1,4-benzoquinol methylase